MDSSIDNQPEVQETVLSRGARIWWVRVGAELPAWRLSIDRPLSVGIHFTLAGTVAIDGTTLPLRQLGVNKHNMFYSGTAGYTIHGPAGQAGEFVQIQLSSDFFTQFSESNSPIFEQLAAQIQVGQPLWLAPTDLPMLPALHTVLTQLMHCPLTCSLKRLFLEAKVLELLALQLGQYEQTASMAIARPPDYEKIVESRRLLEAHFDNPPTLAELSRLVGLNVSKLKKGFKAAFGEPIYNWVLTYRLERAYQLLQSGQFTISEVAYQVGYQHPAHFTTAFKKKFGVVPSHFFKHPV